MVNYQIFTKFSELPVEIRLCEQPFLFSVTPTILSVSGEFGISSLFTMVLTYRSDMGGSITKRC